MSTISYVCICVSVMYLRMCVWDNRLLGVETDKRGVPQAGPTIMFARVDIEPSIMAIALATHRVNSSMDCGRVAEKRSVCRVPGILSRMARNCSWKLARSSQW